MKKTILFTIATLLTTAVMADIPNFGGDGNGQQNEAATTESKVTGDAAEAMYESIAGEGTTEANLRTTIIAYKVLRAADGLDQVICRKTITTMGRKRTSYDCSTESSNNGKKLKVYKPAIKMG